MADGKLVFDTKIDIKGFKKGAKKLTDMAKKSAKVVAGSMTLMGGYAVKVGKDFEAGMSEVQAISGATAEEMIELTEQAKHMGATTVFTATESAEALKYMGMAGWGANQMIEGLPGVMNLAAASGEELGLVADIVTDALSAFKMEAGEASKFADLLASTATNSNTNVGMMGHTFKYVAPVAGALGYTAEDTALAIGLMANAGIKASQAGTSLRGFMTRLVKPTEESGQAMKDLGLEILDSEGNMKPFIQILEELRASMSELTPEQQAMYSAMLAGQQGMSGLLALVNAGEEDFEKLTKATREYTGSAEKMANQKLDNLFGDVKLLGSAVEGLGISMYDLAKGGLRETVQGFTDFIEKIHDTTKASLSASTKLSSFGIIISQELGKMIMNISNKVPEMVNGGLSLVDGFLQGLSMNADDIVTTMEDSLIKTLDIIDSKLPGIMEKGGQIVMRLVQGITRVLPNLLETGMNIIGTILKGLSQNSHELGDMAGTLISEMLNIFSENLPMFLDIGMKVVLNFIQGISEHIPQIMELGIELILGLADSFIENIDLIFETGAIIILGLVEGLMEALPTLIEEVPRIINSFSDALVDQLPLIIETGFQIVMMLIKGIINAIPTLIANIPQIVMAIINVITMQNWLEVGSDIVKGIGKGITALKDNLPKLMRGIAERTLNLVETIFLNGPEIGKGLIRLLVQGVGMLKDNLPNILGAIGRATLNIIRTVFQSAPEIGRSLINLLGSGITALRENLPNILRGIGRATLTAIKTIFTSAPAVGKALISNLVKGISSVRERLPNIAKSVGRGALNGIRGVFKGTVNIGKSFVKGIWSGISNMTGWIGNKVSGFATNLTNKFKSFFNINSPSKLMEDEIGKNISLGIGVGMEGETRTLEKQADTLSKKVQAGLLERDLSLNTTVTKLPVDNSPRDSVDYSRGGVVQHITIQSTTDSPSEHARKIKRAQEEIIYGY